MGRYRGPWHGHPLSLRAKGTSLGFVYDEYTTIVYGTSMACPTAAGVCALVLSANPTLSVDQLTTIMKTTGDPINDKTICESDTKINAYNAMTNAITSKGYVRFDRNEYTAPDTITIYIGDADLAAEPSVRGIIWLLTNKLSGGPEFNIEVFTLYPMPGYPGLFSNSILTSHDPGKWYDDTLFVVDGTNVEAFYTDQDDGSGQVYYCWDDAVVDCVGPKITVTQPTINPVCESLDVHVESTESLQISIHYSQDPNLTNYYTNSTFGTSVDIKLNILAPGSTYYFEVHAKDAAGNLTIDNNQGLMYSFTTTPYDPELQVPGEYGIIQQAIDAAWNGATVVVAQGTYTESINYNGKSITVKSTNPDNTQVVANTILVSPNANAAIIFNSFEKKESVFSGFTITSTDNPGIFITGASPLIKKCRLFYIDGIGQNLESGIHIAEGAPLIEDVVIDN